MAGNSRAGRGRSGQETKLKAGCRANTPPPLPDPAEPRGGPDHDRSTAPASRAARSRHPSRVPRLAPRSAPSLTARASPVPVEPGECMVPDGLQATQSCGSGAPRVAEVARARRAGGRRRPERLQPARTSALLAARGSASARPARRGRGGAPRRERPGAGRAGKPKYTAPRRGRVLRRRPIGAGPARRGPMRPAGGRVIGAWLRRDPEGREAARVLVRARGGA